MDEKVAKKQNKTKHIFMPGFFILSVLGAASFLLFGGINSVSAKNFTIYNATNVNQPYFSVNGTTGFVGIGTTSPLSTLDIPDGASSFFVGNAAIGSLGITGQNSIVMADAEGNLSATSSTSFFSGNNILSLWGGAKNGNIWNGDAGVGNVGIGTTGPSFPLSFSQSLGNKIGLYQTGTGLGYGLGIQGGLLQIFAPTAADRVGIGYGSSDSFTETLTVKAGNVGIGVINPTSILQIPNNSWISALNNAGTGSVNMFKINASNQIEVGAPLNIGSFEFSPDSGLVTLADMPVSSAPSINTPEGYSLKVDGENIMTVYSEANGAGGVQNKRVGINIINPLSTLDLPAGGLYAQDATVGSLGITGQSSVVMADPEGNLSATSSTSFFSGNNILSLWGGAKNGNIWNGDAGLGNVGIGTTDPGQKLQVAGNAYITGYVQGGLATMAGGTGKAIFGSNSGATPILITRDGNDAGTDLYISSTGNVGIGTTNPAAKLTVNTGVDQNLNIISGPMYGGADGVSIASHNDAADAFKGLYFVASNFGFLNGSVGIGTTAPLSKLDISGGTGDGDTYNSVLSLSRMSSTGNRLVGKIVLDDSNTNNGDIRFKVKTTASAAESDAYYTDAMIIKGVDGKVGIGTTNPLSTLDIPDGASSFFVGNAAIGSLGITGQNSIVMADPEGNLSATSSASFFSGNNILSLWGGTKNDNIWNGDAGVGNVGIGTTAPGNKLTVVGSINVNSNVVAGAQVLTLGDASSNPGYSCLNILTRRPNAASGVYWVKPDSATAFQVYCDMTTDGGGWTLVMQTSNSSAYVFSNSVWTNTSGGSTSAGDPSINQDYVSQAFYRLKASESKLALGSTSYYNTWYHQNDTPRNLSNQTRMTGAQAAIGACTDINCGLEPINLKPTGIEQATPGTNAGAWHRFGYVNDNNTSWGGKIRVGFSGDNDSSDSTDTTMGLGLECFGACLSASVTDPAHGTGSGYYFFASWARGTPYDDAKQGWLWVREMSLDIDGSIRSLGNISAQKDVNVGKNLLVSGNVGIGTASPGSLLDISNIQNGTTRALITNTNTGSSARVRLEAVGSGGNIRLETFGDSFASPYGGNSMIYTSGTTNKLFFGTVGTQRMVIDTAGKLGIGTTNPQSTLDIPDGASSFFVGNAAVGSLGITGQNSIVMSDPEGNLSATSSASFFSGNNILSLWGGAKNGNIWNGDAGAGNVGIGTTAPGQKLAVNGNIDLIYGTELNVGRKPKIVLIGQSYCEGGLYSFLVNNGYAVGTVDKTSDAATLASQDYDLYISDYGCTNADGDNTKLFALWKTYGKNVISGGNDSSTGLYPITGVTSKSGYAGAPKAYYHIITRDYQNSTDIGSNNDSGAIITTKRSEFQTLYVDNTSDQMEGIIGESERGGIWFHDQTGYLVETASGQGILLNVIRYMTGADSRMLGWRISNAGFRNIQNQIYIDQAGGNVGIGTTSPGAKLEVDNSGAGIYFKTARTDAGGYFTIGHASEYTNFNSYGPYIFSIAGNEKMAILSNGKVGIGTTSPQSTLDIPDGASSFFVGNAAIGSLGITGQNSVVMADAEGNLSATSSSSFFSGNNILSLWGGAKNGNIWNGDAGVGSVGIGTTAPDAKLDVAGTFRLQDSNLIYPNQTSQGSTFEYPYVYTITVDGDPNTYYPVSMRAAGNGTVAGKFAIARSYGEAGPVVAGGDSGHIAGLQAVFSTMNAAWSDYTYLTLQSLRQIYVRTIADCTMLPTESTGRPLICRLRGGGFVYRIYSNYPINPAQPTPGGVAYNSDPYTFYYPAALPLASLPNNVFQADTDVPVDAITPRLIVQRSTGRVGIGTADPLATLDIPDGASSFYVQSATINSLGIASQNSIVMADPEGNLSATSSTSFFSGNNILSLWGGAKNGNIWNGDAGLGNVGIGVTNPGAQLEVNGSIFNGEKSPTIGASASNPGTSCLNILHNRNGVASGTYWIDPLGTGAFQAYCDMTTEGGGWTLVVSIQGTSRLHVNPSAVGGQPLPAAYNGNKFSDSIINALLGKGRYRFECNSAVAYIEPIIFSADTNNYCQYNHNWGTNSTSYTSTGYCGGAGTYDTALSTWPNGNSLQYNGDGATGCYQGGSQNRDGQVWVREMGIEVAGNVRALGGISAKGTISAGENILVAGKVGIGTGAPQAKLDVDTGYQNAFIHSAVLSGRTSDETGIYGTMLGFQTETNVATYLPKAGIAFVRHGGYGTGDLHFLVDSVVDANPVALTDSKMVILKNGNVGIGTTNPIYRLQIGTSGGLADSIRIGDYQVANNTRQYIGYVRNDTGLFESAGDGDTPGTVKGGVSGIRIVNTPGSISSAQSDNSVQLLTHIYNGGSRVALHANYNGNIGIGTTNPQSTLDIPDGASSFFVQNAAIGSLGITGQNSIVMADAEGNLSATSSSSLLLGLWGGSLGGNIWNANSGNVGIGTTTPYSPLTITGQVISYGENITLNPSSGGYTTIGMNLVGGSAGTGWYISKNTNVSGGTEYLQFIKGGWAGSSLGYRNDVVLAFNPSNGNALFGGNVGIGVINPTSILQIPNNSWISALNNAGTGSVNMFKINASNQIEVGAPLNIGSFEFSPDSGLVTLADMPVSSAPSINTPEGYSLKVDGENIMTVYSEANGAGGVQNKRVGINIINPLSTLDLPTGGLYAQDAAITSLGVGTDRSLIVADSEGTLYATTFSLAIGSTTLNMQANDIINVNKLSVNTIDPLYSINGAKYSTYASAIVGGVKEEYVGHLKINQKNIVDGVALYEKVIDFDKIKEGEELWVWRKVIDFNKDNVEVLITPYGNFSNVYYLIEGNKIIFRSSNQTEISYRLIGKRFDWRAWPLLNIDSGSQKGLIIN